MMKLSFRRKILILFVIILSAAFWKYKENISPSNSLDQQLDSKLRTPVLEKLNTWNSTKFSQQKRALDENNVAKNTLSVTSQSSIIYKLYLDYRIKSEPFVRILMLRKCENDNRFSMKIVLHQENGVDIDLSSLTVEANCKNRWAPKCHWQLHTVSTKFAPVPLARITGSVSFSPIFNGEKVELVNMVRKKKLIRPYLCFFPYKIHYK